MKIYTLLIKSHLYYSTRVINTHPTTARIVFQENGKLLFMEVLP